MKKYLVFLSALLCLFACSGRKNVTQGIEYTAPHADRSYYEFTSYELEQSPLLPPSVTGDILQEPDRPLGEDEDFTSENVSGSYGTYGDVVISVATRKFKLGRNATRKDMAVFQQAMDQGYAAAVRQYRPVGFTYALSSVGAVNPLSDVEVTCKMSEQSANAVGQNACAQFFKTITATYIEMSKEAN
jgi:hypothetical protein